MKTEIIGKMNVTF